MNYFLENLMPFPVGTEVVVTYSCGGTRTKFAGCFWLFIPCGDSMQSVPSMLLFLGNPNKNITKPLNDFAFSLQVQPINYFAELSSHVALSSRGVQDRRTAVLPAQHLEPRWALPWAA